MKIHDSKKSKKTLTMVPPDPRCTIGTKIETKAVLVTSLEECPRRYISNRKTRILVDTILEVEIGPKVTTSGGRRNFVVAIFDLGGGDMKVATIDIRSVKLHTPEPILPDTDGDGGERAAAATLTTTGDTTITYPVSIQPFKAPAQEHLNDEALIVVVVQPISKMPVRPLSPLTEDGETAWPLYPLTEDGGSVVGDVLAHVMDAPTLDMLPPPPVPRLIPVPLPPLPLPPIPSPRTLSSRCHFHGVRPTTRPHSKGEKAGFHGRK